MNLFPFSLKLVINLPCTFLIDFWNLQESFFIFLNEGRFSTSFLFPFDLKLYFCFHWCYFLCWNSCFWSNVSRHTRVAKTLVLLCSRSLRLLIKHGWWRSVMILITVNTNLLWVHYATHSSSYSFLFFNLFLLNWFRFIKS